MSNLIPFPPQPEPPGPPAGSDPENAPKPEDAPASDVFEFKRPRGSGIPVWVKTAQALLLAVAVCFSLGATSSGSRLQYLDHHLMCTCGCAELLGECNHVGCTESTQELNELKAGIAAGQSDQQIFDAFVAKYGATVLAAPPAQGFDLVAWIAPFAVFAAALLGTILLIRRWGGLRGSKPRPGDADLAAGDFSALEPAERERRERIRRETEMDAGFDGGPGFNGGLPR